MTLFPTSNDLMALVYALERLIIEREDYVGGPLKDAFDAAHVQPAKATLAAAVERVNAGVTAARVADPSNRIGVALASYLSKAGWPDSGVGQQVAEHGFRHGFAAALRAAALRTSQPTEAAVEVTDGIAHPKGTILYEDDDGNTRVIRGETSTDEGGVR